MSNLITSILPILAFYFLIPVLYLSSLINSFLIFSRTGIFLSFNKISIVPSHAGREIYGLTDLIQPTTLKNHSGKSLVKVEIYFYILIISLH